MGGKVYNSQSQQLIYNLLDFFALEKQNQGPFIPVTAVYDRVCTALKISSSSLTKLVRIRKENPGYRPVTPPINQHKRGRGKVQTLDDLSKEAIRRILEEYCESKIPVTMKTMHTLLKDKELFPYSKASMRLLIQDLGYYFKSMSRQTFLFKRTDIPNEIVWLERGPKDDTDDMESDCV